MNLMLSAILICVAVGLLSLRFTRRTDLIVAAIATAMTGLYYFTNRFMT